jgi:hypothetical protein
MRDDLLSEDHPGDGAETRIGLAGLGIAAVELGPRIALSGAGARPPATA